jgi:hypothetical protein
MSLVERVARLHELTGGAAFPLVADAAGQPRPLLRAAMSRTAR